MLVIVVFERLLDANMPIMSKVILLLITGVVPLSRAV